MKTREPGRRKLYTLAGALGLGFALMAHAQGDGPYGIKPPNHERNKELATSRYASALKACGDKPDVLVLEKLYSHHNHPTTASIMGHLRGVICLLCAQRDIKLSEQSVKRIRKALVGNGNATKIQTQRVVAHVLHVDERKLTLDASDALALALGYQHLNRLQI